MWLNTALEPTAVKGVTHKGVSPKHCVAGSPIGTKVK